MTNSESTRKAEDILRALTERLDEDRLKREIDDPIDRAAADFTFDFDGCVSHRVFNKVIAAFVRHVYRHGLSLAMNLSPAQAGAEAISILDRGYQGVRVRGYDAALAVAMGKHRDNMKHVLEQIAEIIKSSQRAMYTRWVFVQCLSQLDWQTRRRITEMLLAEIGLSDSAPGRFVKSIPDLVNIYVRSTHSLRKHLAPPVFSELHETAGPDQPLILMKEKNTEEYG